MKLNKINKDITSDDKLFGKGKSAARIAEECLRSLETARPYVLTCIDEVPEEHKKEAEKALNQQFELWANSWAAPYLRAIIAKSGNEISPPNIEYDTIKYRCAVCGITPVDANNGYDTCDACSSKV